MLRSARMSRAALSLSVAAALVLAAACSRGAPPRAAHAPVVEVPTAPARATSAPEPPAADAGVDVSVEAAGDAAAPDADAAPPAGGVLRPLLIQRVIRRNLKRFRFCYEKILLKQPTASGKVTVRFTIEPDGHVGRAMAVHASGIAELDQCIVREMQSLRFPRAGTSTVVNYPFVFAAPMDAGAPTGKP